MTGRCVICGSQGWTYVHEYRGYLCRDHYQRYIEAKVDRCIKRQGLLNGVDKVLIALSGGKDSSVLAVVMKKLYSWRIRLAGLHIDLGIPGYSESARKSVLELSNRIELPIEIVKLQDYGFTIKEAADLYRKGVFNRPPCSVCGTVKRYLINLYAYEKGFEAIATGHNLDDLLLFSSMDIVTGDVTSLSKLLPRQDEGHPKLVPRIRPLCLLTNRETELYTEAAELPVSREKCPYKPPPRRLRSVLSEELDSIEEKVRGFKHMYAASLWSSIIPSLSIGKPVLRECSICGMPSSGRVCSFCRIRESLRNTGYKERFL